MIIFTKFATFYIQQHHLVMRTW